MKTEDEKIFNGLRNGDLEMIHYIYTTFFPTVENMVIKLNGNKEDAQDIFQDALTFMYMSLQEKKIECKFSFGSMIYTIARNKRIDSIRRACKRENINIQELPDEQIEYTEDNARLYDEIEKFSLYEKHFNLLSPECQKILKFSMQDMSLKEITYLLKFKNDDYTKHRRYKCKEHLMKSIFNDPAYKELKYDEH